MSFNFRLPLEWGRYGDEMSVAPLSRQGHSIIAHRFNGGVVSEGIENESLWDGRRFRLERWTRIGIKARKASLTDPFIAPSTRCERRHHGQFESCATIVLDTLTEPL